MTRYSRLGYWRGGLPVERGSFPATLEWRSVRETTDNPELFMGWIQDMEAVVATAGLALTSEQRGDRSVEWRAAGHVVARLVPKFGGGWAGTVYARPVGGPGPGARGAVAAEELRRSSQWLGYQGYGVEFQLHLTPEQQAARQAKLTAEQETLVVSESYLRQVMERQEQRLAEYLASNPEAQQRVAEAKTRRNIGIGVGVLGGAIGVGVALLGGKVGLGFGAKIAIGAAGAAAAVGGTVVAATSSPKLDDILANMQPPAQTEFAGAVTEDQHQKLLQMAKFDSPSNPFYRVDERPNPGVVAEVFLRARSHKIDPSIDTSRNLMLTPMATPDPTRELEGSAGITGHETHYRGFGSTRGYTLDGSPTDSTGKPYWIEVMKVTSNSSTGLICHPMWYAGTPMRNVAGTCWHSGMSTADAVSSMQNVTVLYDNENEPICVLRHWRWMGEPNAQGRGWMTGYQPDYYRQCCGGDYDPVPSSKRDRLQWCGWGEKYKDWLGPNTPPRGFFMTGQNAYLQMISNANGVSGNVPTGMLATEQPDPGWPKDIKGPMTALSQVYRSLRAANPAVTMMYWDTPESLFHIVADYAHGHDNRGGWYAVGNVIGTVLGIASFVCEVASPIISAVNPAAGAALGTAIRIGTQVGSTVQKLTDEYTSEGKVSTRTAILDAMSIVGDYAGYVMDAPGVQQLLKEGWSKVTNLADNIAESCDGWLSLNGIFAGDITDEFGRIVGDWREVLGPYDMYANLLTKTFSGASQNIMATINDNVNLPFYIDKVVSYTETKPSAIGASIFDYGKSELEKYIQ